MLRKLEGKTAVITGGTEGIGFAAARLSVREGAYVFITGRKELDEAVKAIGGTVSGVQGDVAKLPDLDRLYETVSTVKGRARRSRFWGGLCAKGEERMRKSESLVLHPGLFR